MSQKRFFSNKKKLLTKVLILSGVLNCLFVAIFFYFLIRQNPLPLPIDSPIAWTSKEPELLSNSILPRFNQLSIEELKKRLLDRRSVIYGYKVRDFALSMLVSKQAIDINRALGKKSVFSKWWVDEHGTKWQSFPAMKDEDFEKILLFVDEEKFPQTAQGLFFLLKNEKTSIEPTLYLSFTRASEFLGIEQIFYPLNIPKTTICALCLDLEWEIIESCCNQLKNGADPVQIRRELLLKSVHSSSSIAAYLFLLTDADFAANQLDDRSVKKILTLLPQKTKEAEKFASKVAQSPREDSTCALAFQLLEKWGEDALAGRQGLGPRPSIGELRPLFRDPTPAAPPPGVHVIEPGESLWTISRKYRVSLEELLEINHLQSTTVHPGKTLVIPRH